MSKSKAKQLIGFTGFALSTQLLIGCGTSSESQSACGRILHKIFDCRDAVIPFTADEDRRSAELIKTVCDLVEESIPCNVDPRIECATDNITCEDLFPDDQVSILRALLLGRNAFEGCPDITEECEADFDQLVQNSSDIVDELLTLLSD